MHLAQVNLARPLGPMDGTTMSEFARAIEPMNRLAEQSPGFVWRLQGDEVNRLVGRVFGDSHLLVNLSVWRSVDALRDYTYQSGHAQYVRRRKEWFSTFGRPHYALWWVDEGHRPSPREAKQRLESLQAHGPTPDAFTFTHVFDPSGLDAEAG
ncbi:DUF3291 domain-containing protein [Rubrivirga marina]|uniref:DUF3291 domain-containing protein n=1 Tax=Rubrivirga marina TaxID=1196024 RepID=A0A271J3F9_9BACT|nr:DUF3291 domain-containing protein [Rubrivirga marina]PAP77495.1 hypothetical protein BSZ37_14130 [Rubrivirga marina]